MKFNVTKIRATLATVSVAVMLSTSGLAQAAELQTAKIFYPGAFGWAGGFELVEVADAKGFFKKHGIDAQLTTLPWDQYTVALDSGAIDFAPYADYAYFINVYDKGVKAKEVVSSTLPFDPRNAGDALVVDASGPIKSGEDLKGKKIGTVNPSFSGVWFVLDWLGKKGITKDDVTIVTIPQAQLEQVLKQGGVDAIIAYSPLDAELRRRKDEGFRELFQWTDVAGRPVLRGGTMASEKTIAERPDLVKGYVAAIAEAADWANGHPADVVKLGIERGRIAADLAPYIYTRDGKGDYSTLSWSTHGLNKEADIAFWLDVVERAGIVPKGRHKPSDFYTNEFNPHADKTASN
ncbi:ABC transporter substrate-binding protein [Rhizobium sp. KVB221]|uniref:ABC transporter substrate-binding protein n=1 Tax=Rhizobium setariae TaxID=2801340 RepID=A0A936YRX8_9HYPH|nr:ABC transporter substrate-binding protein [Rhizobium setariae]MBL0373526.1 ABC transporter substrate-binding protein [Rhizobium setariae]